MSYQEKESLLDDIIFRREKSMAFLLGGPYNKSSAGAALFQITACNIPAYPYPAQYFLICPG